MQTELFAGLCRCLQRPTAKAGLCHPCYGRRAHSRRCFGGHRERVLRRDGFACRVCGSGHLLNVHHRRDSRHQPRYLMTLCAGCHARIHRTRHFRRWVPEILLTLWREVHPGAPLQLQLRLG